MISFSAANYLIFFENRASSDWKLKQLSLHFATIIDKKKKKYSQHQRKTAAPSARLLAPLSFESASKKEKENERKTQDLRRIN